MINVIEIITLITRVELHIYKVHRIQLRMSTGLILFIH